MTSEAKVENLPVERRPQAVAAPGPDYTPRTFPELIQWAEIASASGMVPRDYQNRPQAIVIAAQFGAEVGLKPIQALQNIAVINNRPGLWGDAMLGLVKSSGLLESIREEEDDNFGSCVVKRRGEPNEHTAIFTLEDARKAGLLGKTGPWTQYPRRMMKLRARGFALRDVFPDVLKGLASAEELHDIEGAVVVDNGSTTVTQAPAKAEGPDKVAAMKQRIREKRATNTTTLVDITARIERAVTAPEMQTLIEEIEGLPDEIRSAAGHVWKDRLKTLKAERAAAELAKQQSQPAETAEAPATDPFVAGYEAADKPE